MKEFIKETAWSSDQECLMRLNSGLNQANYYADLAKLNYSPQYLRLYLLKVISVYKDIQPHFLSDDYKKFKILKKKFDSSGPVVNRIKTPDGPRIVVNKRAFDKAYTHILNMELMLRFYATKYNMMLRIKKQQNEAPPEW